MAYGFKLGQIEGLDSSIEKVNLTITGETSVSYVLNYVESDSVWNDNDDSPSVVLYYYEEYKLAVLNMDEHDVGDEYAINLSLPEEPTESFKKAVEMVIGESGGTWEPKFTLHVSGQSFSETLSEIEAYNPVLGDKVALMMNGQVFAHTTVLTAVYTESSLSSITFIDDMLYPGLIKQVMTFGGSVYLGLVDPSNNTNFAPKSYTYNGSSISVIRYQVIKLYTFEE